MFWSALTLVVWLLVVSCTQTAPSPPVPPPPEDLSTWTVPALVQPLKPEPPALRGAPVEAKPTAAEIVYPYTPGTPYQVQVPVGWPLDVLLEPGEQVRNIVGGDRRPGDTPPTPKPPAVAPGEGRATVPSEAPLPESAGVRRWEVREGADGTGETLRSHIFIAASEAGMTTGVIVTTTRRTYYLTCQSVKTSPIRVLRWTYAASTPEPLAKAKEPGILPDPGASARYHVGYKVESQGRPPDWMPRMVADDGKKLYILYPEVTLFGSVPAVRMVGPNGPQLLNARQYLNVVIVDQLPARVELRVGTGETAEVVTITRGDLHTIECPGDAACPSWPAAAQTLARRTPTT